MADMREHEQLVARARADITARHAAEVAPAPPSPAFAGSLSAGMFEISDIHVGEQVVARVDRLEERHARDNRRVFWILVALIAVSFVSAGVFTAQQWRTTDIARQNRVLVKQLADVVDQIQAERKRNTLSACRHGNKANANLRGFFAGLIPAEQRDDPRVKAFLLSAAQAFPSSNCRRQVRERVRGARPTPTR